MHLVGCGKMPTMKLKACGRFCGHASTVRGIEGGRDAKVRCDMRASAAALHIIRETSDCILQQTAFHNVEALPRGSRIAAIAIC